MNKLGMEVRFRCEAGGLLRRVFMDWPKSRVEIATAFGDSISAKDTVSILKGEYSTWQTKIVSSLEPSDRDRLLAVLKQLGQEVEEMPCTIDWNPEPGTDIYYEFDTDGKFLHTDVNP